MTSAKIANIVGARPNFMKMAPVVKAMKKAGLDSMLIHTGQHYDAKMSDQIFSDLQMPKPDLFLGVGSGSHAEQTAKIMVAFEKACLEHQFDWVVVPGDVNSTVAAALVASKMGIKIAHVESGLRSFDRQMPEEVNRVVTDHLSDLLFVTEPSGIQNLLAEGIPKDKSYLVGNCMVDSLYEYLPKALEGKPWENWNLEPGNYALVTLHRPSNVDDPKQLLKLLDVLSKVSQKIQLLFPVHPRTRSKLEALEFSNKRIQLMEPASYLDFIGLMAKSRFVLTDSGGIQEETTALKVPCLTLRQNTERPITVEQGSNYLLGDGPDRILEMVVQILEGKAKKSAVPELWDGKAAERIIKVLCR